MERTVVGESAKWNVFIQGFLSQFVASKWATFAKIISVPTPFDSALIPKTSLHIRAKTALAHGGYYPPHEVLFVSIP